MRKLNLDEVRDFIETQTPETKIYIGCDSERVKVDKVWYADYITAIVVHINGNNGCKLFGEVVRERDYDQKQNKPRFRLMNEVYKVSELYLKLADVLIDRDVEVHLDINPNEMNTRFKSDERKIAVIKRPVMAYGPRTASRSQRSVASMSPVTIHIPPSLQRVLAHTETAKPIRAGNCRPTDDSSRRSGQCEVTRT